MNDVFLELWNSNITKSDTESYVNATHAWRLENFGKREHQKIRVKRLFPLNSLLLPLMLEVCLQSFAAIPLH